MRMHTGSLIPIMEVKLQRRFPGIFQSKVVENEVKGNKKDSTTKQRRRRFIGRLIVIVLLCVWSYSIVSQEIIRHLTSSDFNNFVMYGHNINLSGTLVVPSTRSITSESNGAKPPLEVIIGGALCISSRLYGRTFNRIMMLANALAMMDDKRNTLSRGNVLLNNSNATADTVIHTETFIGLPPILSEWYESFLDERSDIVLNYTGPCLSTWNSKTLFLHKDYRFKPKSQQQLQYLLPKRSFRLEAERALAAYSKNGQQQVITVHRRNLEGLCNRLANLTRVSWLSCNNPDAHKILQRNELINICNYEYKMIKQEHGTSIDRNESIVVLCTDEQVPELDETFPTRSNYSFPVEAWMMTKSDIHYGNPYSTVDLVVSSWRTRQRRTTHPISCYEA
jgi:hypothetical protein